MVKNENDIEDLEVAAPGHGGRAAVVTTAIVAAAVGAGVAMLFAPEKGSKTRRKLGKQFRKLELRKQLEELELGRYAASVGSGASEGWNKLRKEGRKRLRRERHGPLDRPMFALLGTLAGAAVAVLLAPEAGSETRERISRKFNDLKSDASTRWQEHRAARGNRPDTNGGSDRFRQRDEDRDNVRTVQELGREGSDVF